MKVFWAGIALLLALGCDDSTRTSLVLTGSSTVAPLASEMGKKFEALHPGVRVDVQTGGSSRGIADVRQGAADLGMVSRALRSEEGDLTSHAVALDGIGLIVHQENPIAELSDAEVVGIYTGSIEDWSQVGGSPGPITVVHKAEGRSTLELFLQHFKIKNSRVRPDVVIGDNEQGIKTVAGNPGAVGYVSIGTAEYDAAIGVPVRLLPTRGVEATTASVATGRFPLTRSLNFVALGPPTGLAEEFLAFVRSSAVHDTVRGLHFVPITD